MQAIKSHTVATTALRINYKNYTQYLITTTAGEYLPLHRVDSHKPQEPLGSPNAGYQRPLLPKDIAKCADFILEQAGIGTIHAFPSIVVATRKPLTKLPDGRILLTTDNPLWVLDGQKRTAALQLITDERNVDISDFPIVLQVFENLEWEQEMGLFEDINTNTTPLQKDILEVNEAHVTQLRMNAGLTVKPRALIGVTSEHVVRLLRDDEQSAWYKRIAPANTPKYAQPVVGGVRIVRGPVFRSTLGPIVKHVRATESYGTTEPELAHTVYMLVNDYWYGLAQAMPEAFVGWEAFADHVIQARYAVEVLHGMLLQVYGYAQQLIIKKGLDRREAFFTIASGMPALTNPVLWVSQGEFALMMTGGNKTPEVKAQLAKELAASARRLGLKNINS